MDDPIGAYLDAQEMGSGETPATEFPEVSGELALLLFSEARLQDQIRDIIRHMNLPGEPGELPVEKKRAVAAELMKEAVVAPGAVPRPESGGQHASWWAFWRRH